MQLGPEKLNGSLTLLVRKSLSIGTPHMWPYASVLMKLGVEENKLASVISGSFSVGLSVARTTGHPGSFNHKGHEGHEGFVIFEAALLAACRTGEGRGGQTS